MAANSGPLSLQELSLLSIACHSPTYPADTLALIPPRLRSLIALNLNAIDLHRIEKCPEFLHRLGTMTIDNLWKRRYETTLSKFSNVANFDLDLDTHCSSRSLSLSPKDRYLMACLLNIPNTYSESSQSVPLFGWALFGITDLTLLNGKVIKKPINTNYYGFKCFRGRGQADKETTWSCNFISGHYLELLNQVPYCQRVGTKWPLKERLEFFMREFPGWIPPYIPIQYDQENHHTDHIINSTQGALIYSHYYETRHYAEIDKTDERPLTLNDSFQHFFKTNHSLDRVIIFAPAVQKGRHTDQSRDDNDGDDGEISVNIQPLSITASSLARVVITSLPTLRHLSIAMHWADTGSLDTLPLALPSLHNSLQTLHLRVIRPKFSAGCNYTSLGRGLCELYRNCRTFEELILQGISFDFNGFKNMIYSYLNTPPTNSQSHHSLVLRTVKVLNSEEDAQIEEQIMPRDCHYTKSLFLHRIIGGSAFCKVFSAYSELFMNTLSFSTLQSSGEQLFPSSSLKFYIRNLLMNKVSLDNDSIKSLFPPLEGEIEKVEMSVEAFYPLTLFKSCLDLCANNLVRLELSTIPGVIRSPRDLEFVFASLFSLPASTLCNLELNVTQLVINYASRLAPGIHLNLANFLVQSTVGKITNHIDLKCLFDTWTIIYKAWENNALEKTKIKSLRVPSVVLEEMDEVLSQMAVELIEETL